VRRQQLSRRADFHRPFAIGSKVSDQNDVVVHHDTKRDHADSLIRIPKGMPDNSQPSFEFFLA